MKGLEKKKEVKKEKSEKVGKAVSDYQREKSSKSDKGMGALPKK